MHTDFTDPVEILKKKAMSTARTQAKLQPTKKTREIVADLLRGIGNDIRTAINTEAASLMIRRTKRVSIFC